VAREYEPVAGQWYENIDESESFRVLSVDEDSELIEIEYLDGDIEELDLDTWRNSTSTRSISPKGGRLLRRRRTRRRKRTIRTRRTKRIGMRTTTRMMRTGTRTTKKTKATDGGRTGR